MRRCQEVHLWKAPKVKSCLSHLREKMPFQKLLIPGQIIGLHIEGVGMYVGIRVIPGLSVGLSIWQARLERNGDTVPP